MGHNPTRNLSSTEQRDYVRPIVTSIDAQDLDHYLQNIHLNEKIPAFKELTYPKLEPVN